MSQHVRPRQQVGLWQARVPLETKRHSTCDRLAQLPWCHCSILWTNAVVLTDQAQRCGHGRALLAAGADEDVDLQGAVHEDAASASSDDDADIASVDTDDSGNSGDSGGSERDGTRGAHAAPGDEFAQFFRRSTCVGHTCSSGAHAAVLSWFYRSSASNRPH